MLYSCLMELLALGVSCWHMEFLASRVIGEERPRHKALWAYGLLARHICGRADFRAWGMRALEQAKIWARGPWRMRDSGAQVLKATWGMRAPARALGRSGPVVCGPWWALAWAHTGLCARGPWGTRAMRHAGIRASGPWGMRALGQAGLVACGPRGMLALGHTGKGDMRALGHACLRERASWAKRRFGMGA